MTCIIINYTSTTCTVNSLAIGEWKMTVTCDEIARFEDIILVPSAVYKFICLDIDILAHSRICFLEIVQGFCFYD